MLTDSNNSMATKRIFIYREGNKPPRALKINLHIGQTLPDFLPLTTAVPENQIFHCKISSHRIGNAWQSNRPELGNFSRKVADISFRICVFKR